MRAASIIVVTVRQAFQQVARRVAMARFIRSLSPWPTASPRDPLDRIALVLTLMIIWRLTGGC